MDPIHVHEHKDCENCRVQASEIRLLHESVASVDRVLAALSPEGKAAVYETVNKIRAGEA